MEWVAAGITDIVDARSEADDSEFVAQFSPGVRYHQFPTDDDGRQRPDEWFDAGTAVLREIFDETDRVALVHCAMGVNRGPSMAFAALLSIGWDPVVALDAIRGARPVAVVFYAEDAVRWAYRGDRARVAESVAAVHEWFSRNIADAEWIIERIGPTPSEDRT